MAGDYAPHIDRFGNTGREDPSRNLGLTYGSPGPWGRAVFEGLGYATAPVSKGGVVGMGVQAATGKSLLDHALSAMGIHGGMSGLLGGNPAAAGLTPDQVMAMGGKGVNSGGFGGLLDMIGNAGFSSGPNFGRDLGGLG